VYRQAPGENKYGKAGWVNILDPWSYQSRNINQKARLSRNTYFTDERYVLDETTYSERFYLYQTYVYPFDSCLLCSCSFTYVTLAGATEPMRNIFSLWQLRTWAWVHCFHTRTLTQFLNKRKDSDCSSVMTSEVIFSPPAPRGRTQIAACPAGEGKRSWALGRSDSLEEYPPRGKHSSCRSCKICRWSGRRGARDEVSLKASGLIA